MDVKIKAMHQMLQGLDHLHRHSVIHRDVKPGNILVKDRPPNVWIVLADFGHATQEEYSQDHTKGTINYWAPEILELKRARPQSGKAAGFWSDKSDIFSLGLTGFQLVHNLSDKVYEVPVDKDRHEAFNGRLGESSLWIDGILQQMIAWRADDRPSTEIVLQKQWQGYTS